MVKEKDVSKIDVIFCDDTKMPRKVDLPPDFKENKNEWENFFIDMNKKFGIA